ncbi:MAG TPA: histidine kinase dimerization/phosphoacceptor domain -containing protein [Saprospiraceae bacterium]|nr:histidine kinase dimerization/phosphoacceptor domain -containing protein [Saprospiraceae bacterium]HMP23987.1 histidine kinase dimerization/phosphoacceptor domain -containing protein [Saprospiraceae bacterium]
MAHWHYGAAYRQQDSILHHLKQYVYHASLIDDKRMLAATYIDYGTILKDLGRYKEGEKELFNAIDIYEQLKDQAGIAKCYRRLCDFARHVSDFQEAIRCGELAVKMHRENGSSMEQQMDPLLCMMTAYNEAGQPEKAIEQANRLLDARKKGLIEDDVFNKVYIYQQRALAYIVLQRYEQAIADYEAILRLESSIDKKELKEGPIYETIAMIAYLKKEYAAAIPSFLKYIEYEQAQQNEVATITARLQLAECYDKINNPQEAYRQVLEAAAIQKKDYENKLAAIRAELRDKYEADQKEETIQQQQSRLQQQQIIQWLSLGVVGLFALLLAGLLLTYRNNRRRNLQLQSLNQNLVKKNQENELLLKEIHHRVKNNLEIVSSLLSLQSAQMEDSEVQNALQASRSRVQSMGILHQRLYQGENLAAIEMKDYLINLSEGLLDTFNAEDRVKIECAMQELELDVDTAVPIGLIVNELLTNALKYAFPEGKPGAIKLSLESMDAETLQLRIADNGVGKKMGAAVQGTGFGTQLVNLLTRQLEGIMTQEVNNGTIISFQFKKTKVA